ncbi:MAG: hypothetical protein ACFFA5_00250 [Promethearchaeota archaeon]
MLKRFSFTLTPSESKRLIGKGVASLPEVKNALSNGKIIIIGGSTNGYVAEEILQKKIDRQYFAAGMIKSRGTCLTKVDERIPPIVIEQGNQIEMKYADALNELKSEDVVIKGANALYSTFENGEYTWYPAIMTAHPVGGTVGALIGPVRARGANLIMPVGLEKLIPLPIMQLAALDLGIKKIDYPLGLHYGIMPVVGAKVITEIEACQELFDLDLPVFPVGAGGVNGAEGAITLVVEGNEEKIKNALELIKSIKGEPSTQLNATECKGCTVPCLNAE